jgi:sulfur carrier protein
LIRIHVGAPIWIARQARNDDLGEYAMIAITLNGETRELPPGQTLADLIAALDAPPPSLATAVNGEFVARDARHDCKLQDGDAVFTFQPITGG